MIQTLPLFKINIGSIITLSGNDIMENSDYDNLDEDRRYEFMNMGKYYMVDDTYFMLYPTKDKEVFDNIFISVLNTDAAVIEEIGDLDLMYKNISQRLLYALTCYVEEPFQSDIDDEIELTQKAIKVISTLKET